MAGDGPGKEVDADTKQKTEIVGVISSEGPPVPIPNTAVKLT